MESRETALPEPPREPPAPRFRPPAPTPPADHGVQLRVGKRVLWVGEAAYPLANVVRVYTTELTPKRWEAFGLFLLVSVIVYAVGSAAPDAAAVCLLIGGVALAWFLKVACSSSRFVLTVDTAGPATALVTLPDRERLRALVETMVHAIENPDTEVSTRVEIVNFNPRHYHSGDRVNMYGGLGNTGILGK